MNDFIILLKIDGANKDKWMNEDLDISDITSLAWSLLYEAGAIKAGRGTKTCANSTPWPPIFCPFPLTSGYHAAVHRYICDQTWRGPWVDAVARFEERVNFSPQQWPYFSQLGHCYIWQEPAQCWRYCYCTLMRSPPHEDDDNSDYDNGGKLNIIGRL